MDGVANTQTTNHSTGDMPCFIVELWSTPPAHRFPSDDIKRSSSPWAAVLCSFPCTLWEYLFNVAYPVLEIITDQLEHHSGYSESRPNALVEQRILNWQTSYAYNFHIHVKLSIAQKDKNSFWTERIQFIACLLKRHSLIYSISV